MDKVLAQAAVPGVIRAWAGGDPGPGLALWRSLAGAGVFAVAVPERAGGAGVLPVELVTAFHELGRHGVPGPCAETVAAAVLLDRLAPDSPWPAGIADGTVIATLAPPPTLDSPTSPYPPDAGTPTPLDSLNAGTLTPPDSRTAARTPPYALDADVAAPVLMVAGAQLRAAVPGRVLASLDPARRLFPVTPGDVLAAGPEVVAAAGEARDLGTLVCAAQLTGLGRRLLEVSVEYVRTRRQFGRPIGEFQAVRHQLANALVELEYARPLVYGAALAHGTPDFAREVSAAKVMASEAAYRTARIALQVHGAIGYTDEYDLSLLIRKARALRAAWGSPTEHRARLMSSLS
ncbi:acyl-CoA dehydrogenase FadE32 [Nonomuraea glycinis]|uniref:Acyl-CoA dehydrogenase FadE32 n=1 Tax=Nonomuraea glycinis TaxID=2047744 RepID=A0A918ACM6_9ACTN|nr:acyl-CoA dehydrogenase FadE32 [Nonomuraea glycinis]